MKPLSHFVSCVFAIVVITASASSQGGWVEQTSGTSHHLFGIHFVDPLTGWVVGGTDPSGGFVILHTSDGGSTWITQATGAGLVLYDVCFVDETTGWAVGEAGTIIHTTNGGISWNPQVSNDPHNLFGVQFIDANNGWIGGDWSTLLRTTNGGAVWTQETLATSRAIDDFEFLDPNLGWLGGNYGDIFKTTDGGDTWVQQVTGVDQDLSTPAFLDPQTGWTCGGDHGVSGGGIILHTTDGGTTWNPQPFGRTNNIMDVFFFDENTGWACGGWADNESIVLHTSDGGTNWEVQTEGATAFLRRMFFVTATEGWVVGSEGTILHTNTGGKPSQDPVAKYPFNGNANDESGNENHGTVFGATLTTDRFGTPNSAYHFGGGTYTGDYIIASADPLPTADRTISLWFLNEDPDSGAGHLAYGGGICGTSAVLSMNDQFENRQDHYNFHGACLVNALDAPYPSAPGSDWHHLVLTIGPLGTKIYLDAQLIGSNDIYVTNTNTLGKDLIIGAAVGDDGIGPNGNNWSIGYFPGKLDDILIYDRVLSDEEILELYGEPFSDPLAPYGVTYGSTGSANTTNPGALLTIDPMTGDATLVGPTGIIGDTGPSVPALAIKSTGEMYAVSASTNSGLYTIDAPTGAGTFVASTGLSLPNAMAFDGYDELYITDGSGNLYTLDETTGAATLIGALGFNVRGIAFDPTDGTMYGSSGTDGIYTIDPTTATATFLGNTGLGGSTPDIHFDLDGNLFGTKIGAGTIYNYVSINKITGTGTVIGSTGFTAVIGLSARQVRSDVVPVTMEIEIDSLNQVVPPGGATFPYAMTFTNNTPRTQTIDYWTKLVRPTGNPFDPFDGPITLALDPFETVAVDTNELSVPPSAVPGEYFLIGYVGDYQIDTLDVDSTGFTKLDDSIPCGDIAQFKARCRPGGLIQAKAIFPDFTHVGETVEISVDQFPYEVTVGINGQATFSQTGFNPGVHTVELTNPAGCFPATMVTCGAGLAKEGDDEWDETWEIPIETTLLGNYPNPFNPSTTFRYGLSEPGQVSLKVYNMLGQLVRTIVDEQQVEGYHEVLWDGRNETGASVSSGIYLYRMTTGAFTGTKRMLLVK